jgi:FixJ family two-component response regulator
MIPDATVYVVDDDESVRKSLARLIRSVGLRVETFPSAREFLGASRPECPSCLILDLRLPGASGLELQSALGDAARTLPIIFISGVATVPASVRAMKGGALDFLQKPFDEAELLDRIRQALTRSHEALTDHAQRAAIQRRLVSLTPRERQVLDLVVTGKLNKQIAAQLGAAEKTVKIHRGRVMRKMEAESVAELVRMMHKVSQETSLT